METQTGKPYFLLFAILLFTYFVQRFLTASGDLHASKTETTRMPYQVEPNVDLFHERPYSPRLPVRAQVFGPNLNTVQVNARGKFFIECSLEDCENLYVLFHGPTIFSPRAVTRNATLSTIEFVAPDPGRYKVHVEVLFKQKQQPNGRSRAKWAKWDDDDGQITRF